MKKLLVIGGAIIFIIGGLFFYFQRQSDLNNPQLKTLSYCSDENNKKIDCVKCVKQGKIFPHSFSNTCEIEAKDAGKQCTYDEECAKHNCSYQNENANNGTCAGYLGENDGKNNCHYPRENGKVQCDFNIS